MSDKIFTEPVAEPVSLELAKLHLRVSRTDEDELISLLISAARIFVEEHTDPIRGERQIYDYAGVQLKLAIAWRHSPRDNALRSFIHRFKSELVLLVNGWKL